MVHYREREREREREVGTILDVKYYDLDQIKLVWGNKINIG